VRNFVVMPDIATATEPSTAAGGETVRAGFIPLVDCAPLVIAAAKGFDRGEGFELKLSREASWANIRDKTEFGAFDCAHMLAPMVVANAIGLGPASEAVVAPMVLNLGGSTITVSRRLAVEMAAAAPEADAAAALAAVIRKRAAANAPPLFFGMVFPFSSHNYDLRCWLAGAGIDPDGDVNLVVIPPPLLAESLKQGRIDGFCAGAPWGQVAVEHGEARIVASKTELWPLSPEKVLGVRLSWAERNPELLARLIRALVRAAQWLDAPENHAEAAGILAAPAHIGVAAPLILRVLQGRLVRAKGEPPTDDRDFIVFARDNASFPWRSHALWLATQMIRWGQVRAPFDLAAAAERAYRPDLFRAAVQPLGLSLPATDDRREGPSGALLDPGAPLSYLQSISLPRALDLTGFAPLNS
jgi:NitT/TauT family transport system ATP-binding protein/nitrate/nitrite transport system substrate-binding protein